MNSITTNREFFSEFLVKQTRAGGLWEAVAPLPGGLGGRPPCCRATGPLGASAEIFVEKPLPSCSGATRSRPPGSRAVGVFFCKFRKWKYIFVKNKNKKYKNIKTARPASHDNRCLFQYSPAATCLPLLSSSIVSSRWWTQDRNLPKTPSVCELIWPRNRPSIAASAEGIYLLWSVAMNVYEGGKWRECC